jgi:CheY-like chemotaxis protein
MNETAQTGEESKHQDLKTILIVEDDEDLGMFLAAAIGQETPYRPLVATDGFQALQIIQGIRPDLLLLDYHLPRMSGLEFYDQVHANPIYAHVPAILMTAATNIPHQEVKKRNILSVGKPFELDNLIDILMKFLDAS